MLLAVNIFFAVLLTASLLVTVMARKNRYEYQWILALVSAAVAFGYLVILVFCTIF